MFVSAIYPTNKQEMKVKSEFLPNIYENMQWNQLIDIGIALLHFRDYAEDLWIPFPIDY